MYEYFAVVTVLFGLLVGSFFNVLIWRLPREESIVFPASHCPACSRPIRPWENIPIISFLLLGGKCAGCKVRISWRYPAIELFSAFIAFLLYQTLIVPHTMNDHTVAQHVVVAIQVASLMILIPVAVIDLDHYIIPDSISLTGLVIGIAVSFLPGIPTPQQSLLGILAGGGSLLALGYIGQIVFKKEDAMGGGDIKLMAFLGAVWGWKTALLGIVFGSLLGVIVSLPLMAFRRLSEDHRIPFGPFLAAGTLPAALWGEQCLRVYFQWVASLFPY